MDAASNPLAGVKTFTELRKALAVPPDDDWKALAAKESAKFLKDALEACGYYDGDLLQLVKDVANMRMDPGLAAAWQGMPKDAQHDNATSDEPASNNATSHSVRVSEGCLLENCTVHAVSKIGPPMKYSDHNPITFTLKFGNKSYLVMSWNIDHSNAEVLPALYIQGLKDKDKPDIILTQEDRCGEKEYNANLSSSEQKDFGNMLQEQYEKIYSNGHQACVSNGAYRRKTSEVQVKFVKSCTNSRLWTDQELKALNNVYVVAGDSIERPVDFLKLSSGQSSCTIANVHLDGGRYAEQQISVDWVTAYKFKVKSLAFIKDLQPNIVVGDFNCVYGSLQSQEKYLATKIEKQELLEPFQNALEEFEGTQIGNLTELNAKNAAFIYNKGPIRRLMGAAYKIVLPENYPEVCSSLLGRTLVDLVFVQSKD